MEKKSVKKIVYISVVIITVLILSYLIFSCNRIKKVDFDRDIFENTTFVSLNGEILFKFNGFDNSFLRVGEMNYSLFYVSYCDGTFVYRLSDFELNIVVIEEGVLYINEHKEFVYKYDK